MRIGLEDVAITPVVERFVHRAIDEAAERRARYLLIELDTPGGLVSSTQGIVRAMLESRVPLVVYVAPSGARAASAGLFLTLAAHVAAMAPGTHIGAAHPVAVGGLPSGPRERDPDDAARTIAEKIENDTRAWARSLAQLRGRNADIAERAVAESLSLTDTEALQQGLIDRIAVDEQALLATLERAQGARVETLELDWGQRLLATLANPNLAFVLIIVGFYGLVFELSNPGFGVAGVVGAMALVLGGMGLSVLPMNVAGLSLLLIGLVLFVAEAFVPSFGLLTVGGVVGVALGGLLLVDSPVGFLRVSLELVVPIAIATGLVTLFLVVQALRAQRGRVQTGREGLLGETAQATMNFSPDSGKYAGKVHVHGELWNAVCAVPVESSQRLEVTGLEGLTLEVAPRKQKTREESPL